jgi:hypothetical protein
MYAQQLRRATLVLPVAARSCSQRFTPPSTTENLMPAVKSNRSKKKLKNRAKVKKGVLKRRRVRARKAKGKY